QQDQQDQQSLQTQESPQPQSQEQPKNAQGQPKVIQATNDEYEEKQSSAQLQPLDQELQVIIDSEKRHRINQRTRQSRQNPVDKDW
ncbi:MAG: hypothetical protein II943_13175, partial [Victivallales bacterium]|nr:hypothetical protein [Victivallales bacterium]